MTTVTMTDIKDWWIFKGTRIPHDDIADEQKFPPAPPWRKYRRNQDAPPDGEARNGDAPTIEASADAPAPPEQAAADERGASYLSEPIERDLVNAALLLRRPLLLTGKPGTGKTSLAYAVAYELKLGPVLVWPITTRSTLQDGLYRYDAIARLQAAALKDKDGLPEQQKLKIGNFLRLGPLGTALLPSRRPRVLLIDEIDKSDIDLPNDLLHVFEEGEFEIPELARLPDTNEYRTVWVRPFDEAPEIPIARGKIRCQEFPFVVLTSNNERDFPPAFLRRCLRLNIEPPDDDKLARIVESHLELKPEDQPVDLLEEFKKRRAELATDQLLNAIYLTMNKVSLDGKLRDAILKSLSSP
jgi:MoxR-like ATPase